MTNKTHHILFEDFLKVEMRIGTVIEAKINPKANKPAYVLTIDFGPAGIKTSSAQITEHYTPEDLIGQQVVAVLNFASKLIAGVRSEVLVLGAMSDKQGVILIRPTIPVPNGSSIG
jgi:tRNA-binding protein